MKWLQILGLTFFTAGLLVSSAWLVGHLSHPSLSSLSAKPLKLNKAYGRLPAYFEPNLGQTDPQVKFLCRGLGYNLFLTDTESVLVLRHEIQKQSRTETSREALRHPGRIEKRQFQNEVVRLQLRGAQKPSSVEGLEKLPGISNYFIGNDPQKWRGNIPQYARILLKNVYPGVDMVYYGNQGKLEHDFIVAPGVNPGCIHLALKGAKESFINSAGDLVLKTAHSQFALKAPVVYQELNGKREIVQAGYKLEGRQIAFALKNYDATRTLVIDPVLDYSTYMGGSVNAEGYAIAADAAGNAYVTGFTEGGFPITAGAYQTTYGGSGLVDEIFVSKIDPTGTTLLYSTYIGGSGNCYGNGIAVDSSGNAYVTGKSQAGLPTTAGAYQTSFGGGYNYYVTKLNSTGSALIYSTYLGGSAVAYAQAIALDSSGNAYVAGFTQGGIPTTAGAYQTGFGGGTFGGFVTKLNPAGTALVYSTYLGGTSNNLAYGIAVDSAGNAYVTGNDAGTLTTTAGAYQTVYGGGTANVFVTKLNAAGSGLAYSTYIGGTGDDLGFGIAVDSAGEAYVTGSTEGGYPTTAGAYQTVYGGSVGDAFISKLNAAGSALVYSTYLGGSGYDIGNAVAVDASGNAYVAGSTTGNFPTTGNAPQQNYDGGGNDIFVAELNTAGSALVYSTYVGGSSNERGVGIAVDASDNAYVTGDTNSINFPITANAIQPVYGGANENAYVLKLSNASSTSTITFTPSATPTHTATSTATNTSTNTATNTVAESPTNTATNSVTNTATVTATDTSTDTATDTSTTTVTDTATNSPTVTDTFTITETATTTSTNSPTNSVTNTVTATVTNTATNTATVTNTNTITLTPTATATNTMTSTTTSTATVTATQTGTNTPTVTTTYTNSATPTYTTTSSPTYSPTQTASITPTPTETITATPTPFKSVTLYPPYPNPISGGNLNIMITCPPNTTFDWDAFTLSFRKIAGGRQVASGDTVVTWNLCDRSGTPAANGLYYLRVKTEVLTVPETKIYKVIIAR